MNVIRILTHVFSGSLMVKNKSPSKLIPVFYSDWIIHRTQYISTFVPWFLTIKFHIIKSKSTLQLHQYTPPLQTKWSTSQIGYAEKCLPIRLWGLWGFGSVNQTFPRFLTTTFTSHYNFKGHFQRTWPLVSKLQYALHKSFAFQKAHFSNWVMMHFLWSEAEFGCICIFMYVYSNRAILF